MVCYGCAVGQSQRSKRKKVEHGVSARDGQAQTILSLPKVELFGRSSRFGRCQVEAVKLLPDTDFGAVTSKVAFLLATYINC